MPSTHEAELTGPRELTDAHGRLRPDAVGWSRRPLHDGRLHGSPGRKKRWNYWGVLGDDFFLALTLADVDYLGLATATFVRLGTRQLVERVVVTPLARRVTLPDGALGGRIRFDALGLHLRMDDLGSDTRLTARVATLRGDRLDAEVLVRRPDGPEQESVNVVIPWSERRFQLTSKQVGLPPTGRIRNNGETLTVGDGAFACLDYGRGVWPYRTRWNWAAASGDCGGRTVALNLGGQWTRATGMTENGFLVDGRAHKIGQEVSFELDRAHLERPWRIRDAEGGRVDLVFTPDYTRHVRVELLLLGSELHHALGTFAGTLVADDGERIAVRGLRGWAEEHRARW
jgi:hypothetical protein